jgi:hypothetical protein
MASTLTVEDPCSSFVLVAVKTQERLSQFRVRLSGANQVREEDEKRCVMRARTGMIWIIGYLRGRRNADLSALRRARRRLKKRLQPADAKASRGPLNVSKGTPGDIGDPDDG